MKKGFIALLLAAGEGTRFKSEKPKVLHPLLGKPMLQLVLECVKRLRPERVYVVVGHKKESVIKEIRSQRVNFVIQRRQLGTAHAVMAARKALRTEKEKDLLVINADLPLLRPETLRPFLKVHQREGNSLTFLTAELENPTGFGRVLRSGNRIEKIIEEKDASPSQRKIKEINAGAYLFKVKDLFEVVSKVSNKNRKGEYYLTDTIEIMVHAGKKVEAHRTSRPEEIIGINDRFELAKAVDILRMRKIRSLAEQGVTVYDPPTTWIDLDVKVGQDTLIHSSVILEGKTRIGSQCQIFPFVHIVDSVIGDGVRIFSSTMIEESRIRNSARVGPFTHLRPKTEIQEGARVGNFVEMKNTVFGKQAKAGHLTYLGDCRVEGKVNIGAGTITCNYDGKRKHRTLIGEGAFIGSGVELVAPVKVGKNAYVGAGSTITKDVAEDSLAVARGKQVEKRGWARKKRKK
ncbi:MAG: bifunctional UDP-N-acetylglucosamine diphosphorylase/glucosamine-1-phosphate N-acetyltransferase GlmU [Candidatus Aminicenantales bacterium]